MLFFSETLGITLLLVANVCYSLKSAGEMTATVHPLVLPLPEVEATTKSWTRPNNPWILSAASTRAKAKA